MSFKFEEKCSLILLYCKELVIVTELVSCIMQVPSSSSHIARCFKARHECFFVRREGGFPCRCGSNGNTTIGTR